MPIRTQTVEQAARAFARHYREHLKLNTTSSFIDPRECLTCMGAWETLSFTLDKDNHTPKLEVVGNNKIVDLFR